MDKSIIQQIILEQKGIFTKDLRIIERPLSENLFKSPKIVAITGVRRSGKSTLLRQISKAYDSYAYLNFEDDRLLDFTHSDFNTLIEAFLELDSKVKTFFFDEIQVVTGWERFVRRLFTEGYKLFITGSNAKLLSSEIATSLTGRNLKHELFPFSFREYLAFQGFKEKGIYTTAERAAIASHLNNYALFGGFPEVIATKDRGELKELYHDIIIKDLIFRFKIRDSKEFRELAMYLISNVGNRISFNNLKNLLSFSNTSKVKNYIDFMTQAYLFFLISKYDFSIKKQIFNEKKVYAIDTGLVNSVSFQFSENKGRIIENLVFLELKRRGGEIFYFSNGGECDFVLRKGAKIVEAIQVSTSLSDPGTRKREIGGLKAAMGEFGLKEGQIITESHEETIREDGTTIRIIPLWRFLLGQ